MAENLERFTKRARRVLTLAEEEARCLNHNYIGTEHLLLGLVREENGVAMKVLRELGTEPGQLIRAVERTVGRGERSSFWSLTLFEFQSGQHGIRDASRQAQTVEGSCLHNPKLPKEYAANANNPWDNRRDEIGLHVMLKIHSDVKQRCEQV